MTALTCITCLEKRQEALFPDIDFRVCVFCLLHQARHEVQRLESFLNSTVPKGRSIQELCTRCQTLNWWVNLTVFGKKRICPACKHEEELTLTEVKDGHVIRFSEEGKRSSGDLADLLQKAGLF